MPAIAGLRGTGDWGTDERPKNFRETILWRNPNGSAPITAFLSRMGSESTDDPQFSWWEEEQRAIMLTVNGVMNTTTTTSFVVDAESTTVSGALSLVAGDVLMVEKADATTNEIILVVNVSSDTAFEAARGQAGTVAAAIPTGTRLLKISNVFAEGTNSPGVTSRNPTKLTNYCQIFKTAYEITRTAKGTRARTGDPLKNDKKRKMFDHSVALEFGFLFGRAYETTGSNGKPLRYTGGLRSFITSNVTVFNNTTAITETMFLDAVSPVFDYDSAAGDERLVICGNGFLTTLNLLAKANTQIHAEGVVKIYGMKLQEWITPQGRLYFRTHPLFNRHPNYNYSAFILDASNIKYRHFMDTKMQDNIQANDADTQKGQWITEAGLEVHHEKTMAYLGNFKKLS